jgi:uncharacterized protein
MPSREGPRRSGRSAPLVRRLAILLAVAVVALLPSCGLFDPHADVLLVGDSIMRQGGEYVERQLEADPQVGGVSVRNAGKNGSGLLTPDVYDWHSEADDLIDRYEPEVVVVLFIGNYTSEDFYVDAQGNEITDYTPEFFDAWGTEADRLMEVLTQDGAVVYLVQPPPMASEEGQRRADALRTVYQGVAERWPGTGIVDGGSLAGPDGGFTWELPDGEGQLQPVRGDDSVHLTAFGAERLAADIASTITPALLERRDE